MKQLSSYIAILCYTVISMSCHRNAIPQQTVMNIQSTDKQGHPALLGSCSPEKLSLPPFDTWFTKNYNDYHIDSASADLLKASLHDKQFLIFMGTWCGDSKREVPRMFKILDYCGIPRSAIRLVMVSDADSLFKQSPGHEERGLDIFRVPDLILLDKNRESGRIIESPVNSLEKDLLALSSNQPYLPHYAAAASLASTFKKVKWSRIRQSLPDIAARLRPLTSAPGELTSYARVLRAAGQPEKADIALEINAILFPAGK